MKDAAIFRENLRKKLGDVSYEKIISTRVGIAGAGGLGSNCALNLTRVGFIKFTIADFDKVDGTNLDRQFFFLDQVGMDKVDALKKNLERINPDIEVKAVAERVGPHNIEEIFSDCQIVAECFDTAENKSMLVSRLLPLKRLIVTVSGLGGFGSSDDIKVHRLKDNLILIGDLKSDISARPAISPRVNVAAAKQADAILEHILSR